MGKRPRAEGRGNLIDPAFSDDRFGKRLPSRPFGLEEPPPALVDPPSSEESRELKDEWMLFKVIHRFKSVYCSSPVRQG
jgi:hypothetical protein